MIEVRNLVKNYGSHRAVKNISFNVEPGKIYGFLGPNGAGKSTTMNIITGTLAATGGIVTINGHDIYEEPTEAKKCIGYLPEIPPLYTDMTVNEYLRFVAEAKGIPAREIGEETEEAVSLTGLEEVSGRLIKNLSKGYRQRVGIAQALLGHPDIIILDEPTVGLDPKQIIEIRELIRSLGQNHTVILSSHILSEINEVCDHVIIISKGKIVADDDIRALEEKNSSNAVLELVLKTSSATADGLKKAFSSFSDDVSLNDGGDGIFTFSISYDAAADIREKTYDAVRETDAVILSMVPKIKTLEDIFLELTSDDNYVEDGTEDETGMVEDEAEASKDKDDDNDDGDDYRSLFR